MTFAHILLIASGGFFGAVLRYLISEKLNNNGRLPFGTLLVNLTGALLVGVVFGMKLPLVWTVFLVSGFAGSLTTYSTLNKELILLWQSGRKKTFYIYSLATYALGIVIAYAGFQIGGILWW